SILISERLVAEDYFTSIHIEEFEVSARDTKLGKEEITRDIPNVGEEALNNLDESGIIRIGADVKPGDILAGKITPKGEPQLTAEVIRRLTLEQYERIQIEGEHTVQEAIFALVDKVREKEDEIRSRYAAKIERLTKGDELPPGVIKMVKVYVAIKRKLSVGDKMAGRHGNKGVVSRVLPEEDMPYLEDGNPVDIVLNPLGVPSRMNGGQMLERHLGGAAT